MDEEVLLINKVLGNKEYHAEGKLNEGSYGQIFHVTQIESKKSFALKALELSKLQKLQKMHEALMQIAILGKLSHPGVIRMFAHLRRQNYIGIVLELCPHGDIFTLMKNVNKKLELAKKKRKIMIYYLAQILEVLDYLHAHQIVHRDLKPENIVLGPDLKVRVIDFGTAKLLNSSLLTAAELTQISAAREDEGVASPRKQLVGSANYLSPQALRLQYSQKSDIWAFGVIAYKFYYNQLPFEGHDNMEIFKKIAENQIQLDANIDPELQELFVLSLKKDPAQRANSKMLKMCSLFKDINFKEIFTMEPPIFKEELKSQQEQDKEGQFLFEVPLEKKMFFGNFKPRLLTITKTDGRLFMAYRYLPSKKIKNEFELNLNDYAQPLKGNEFEVVTGDKRYCFRGGKGQEVNQIVEKINSIIKKGYKLE